MTKGTDFGLYRGNTDKEKDQYIQQCIALNLKAIADNLHELIEGMDSGKFTILTGQG